LRGHCEAGERENERKGKMGGNKKMERTKNIHHPRNKFMVDSIN